MRRGEGRYTHVLGLRRASHRCAVPAGRTRPCHAILKVRAGWLRAYVLEVSCGFHDGPCDLRASWAPGALEVGPRQWLCSGLTG
jgi:hypothetical protein